MPSRSRLPHKLLLYRHAVQKPEAEVAFLHRAYVHHRRERGGLEPVLLREDFAGTAAVAAAWVGLGPDHQAMAVERHGPTLRWADRHSRRPLGERAQDLHLLDADVLEITSPRVDITCALNFSSFIYHDRQQMRNYLRHARRGLRRDGILVLDAFGGADAMRLGQAWRRVEPAADSGLSPFACGWEQRRYDAITGRIDCRLHFRADAIEAGGDEAGAAVKGPSAFRYDWRLWTLPELNELMREAGFASTAVWAPRPQAPGRGGGAQGAGAAPAQRPSRGAFTPITQLPNREGWLAYVVGLK